MQTERIATNGKERLRALPKKEADRWRDSKT